jgi:hypothetical protein
MAGERHEHGMLCVNWPLQNALFYELYITARHQAHMTFQRTSAPFINSLYVRGWSEKFSASTIDGNSIGKISSPSVGTSVISIRVKLQDILSSSLFYTAV